MQIWRVKCFTQCFYWITFWSGKCLGKDTCFKSKERKMKLCLPALHNLRVCDARVGHVTMDTTSTIPRGPLDEDKGKAFKILYFYYSSKTQEIFKSYL